MSSDNKRLAQIFKEMSYMYEFMNGANHFRAVAYARASQLLSVMKDDLSTYSEKELEALEGIGHGIATKIEEFIETGKIRKYETLKKQVPFELIQLISLSGFGPKTLKTLHENLGINTKDQLVEVLLDGSVVKLKGFGQKRVDNMLKGLNITKKTEDRITLREAQRISKGILKWLKKCKAVKQIEVAGSIRRKKETIGDIDVLVSSAKTDRPEIIEQFLRMPNVKEVLVKGETKISVRIEDHHRQVDLRLVNEDEWGSALVYLTGSKAHNIYLRTLAKEKGLKISEYGVFRGEEKIAGKTEKEVYQALGLRWVKPSRRIVG